MNHAITHILAGPMPLLILNKLLGFPRRLTSCCKSVLGAGCP